MKTFRLFHNDGTVSVIDIQGHVSVVIDGDCLVLSVLEPLKSGGQRFVSWTGLKTIHEIDREKLCQSCQKNDAARGLAMCYKCVRQMADDVAGQ